DLEAGPTLAGDHLHGTRAGVGVPRAEQVGFVAKREGAVARPHEPLRGGGGPLAADDRTAARGQGEARTAGTGGVGVSHDRICVRSPPCGGVWRTQIWWGQSR